MSNTNMTVKFEGENYTLDVQKAKRMGLLSLTRKNIVHVGSGSVYTLETGVIVMVMFDVAKMNYYVVYRGEDTWYIPTSLPIIITSLSGVTMDKILKYLNANNAIYKCNQRDVMIAYMAIFDNN